MNFIRRLTNLLALTERWLLVVLVFVLVLFSFTQVILRNLFSFGFLWTDPLLRYIVMWVGFLGAAVATREEKHFAVEFFNRFLTRRAGHFLKAFTSLIAAVVVVLLTRAAYQFVMEGIGADEIDLFELPKRLYFAILPIAFGLIALHFVLRAIGHSAEGLRRAPADQTKPGEETTA